jgi:hypothetical protein
MSSFRNLVLSFLSVAITVRYRWSRRFHPARPAYC